MASVSATRCVRVILVACGSFNPVTNMHMRMFELARDALNSTGQYKVVGGIMSPVSDKYSRKKLASNHQRCAMIRLALQTSDWIRLESWESEQPTWTETVKVLRHYSEVVNAPNADVAAHTKKRKADSDNIEEQFHSSQVRVKLLCGSDVLQTFAIPGLWKPEDMQEIVTRFGMVVIARNDTNPSKFIYESDFLSKNKHNINVIEDWIPNEISATRIRTAIRRNQSVKYLLQDSVIDYIAANKLYSDAVSNDNASNNNNPGDCAEKHAHRHRVVGRTLSTTRIENDQRSSDGRAPSNGGHETSSSALSSFAAHRSTYVPEDRQQLTLGMTNNVVDGRNVWEQIRDYRRTGGLGHYLVRSRSADDGTCWQRKVASTSSGSDRKQRTPKHEAATQLVPRAYVRDDWRPGAERHQHVFRHRRRLNLDQENRRSKSQDDGIVAEAITKLPEVTQAAQSSYNETTSGSDRCKQHVLVAFNVNQSNVGRQPQLMTCQPSRTSSQRSEASHGKVGEFKRHSTASTKSSAEQSVRYTGRLRTSGVSGKSSSQSTVRNVSESAIGHTVGQLRTMIVPSTSKELSGTSDKADRDASMTGDSNRLYAQRQCRLSPITSTGNVNSVAGADVHFGLVSTVGLRSTMNAGLPFTSLSDRVRQFATIYQKAETCV